MSIITVNDISNNSAGLSKAGISLMLDTPKPGECLDGYGISVAGSLSSSKRKITAVELAGRSQLARAKLSGGREAMSFSLSAGTLSLPPTFDLKVNAIFGNGESLTLCTISLSQSPLTSGFKPAMQPLLVTSLGRSGSTLMMKMLIYHPRIVALRDHPYEARSASYWMRVLKVLSAPRQPGEKITDNLFGNKAEALGPHPFASDRYISGDKLRGWFSKQYPDLLARFCQESIESYFQQVATDQGQTNPSYFAEKTPPATMQDLVWGLYPKTREIFLVRDFRDTLCSMLAFNEKRGFTSFGRKATESEAEFARNMHKRVRQLHNDWMERKEQACLVRYEDLVLNPEKALTEVFNYLELECTPEEMEHIVSLSREDSKERDKHQTSASTLASVARWKQDLPKELQQICHESFGEITSFFGYED